VFLRGALPAYPHTCTPPGAAQHLLSPSARAGRRRTFIGWRPSGHSYTRASIAPVSHSSSLRVDVAPPNACTAVYLTRLLRPTAKRYCLRDTHIYLLRTYAVRPRVLFARNAARTFWTFPAFLPFPNIYATALLRLRASFLRLVGRHLRLRLRTACGGVSSACAFALAAAYAFSCAAPAASYARTLMVVPCLLRCTCGVVTTHAFRLTAICHDTINVRRCRTHARFVYAA